MNAGGGAAPTKMYAFGAGTFLGKCVDKSAWIISGAMPAAAKASWITWRWASDNAAKSKPKAFSNIWFGMWRIFSTPALTNTTTISRAYDVASRSPRSYSISTSNDFAIGSIARTSAAKPSLLGICRHVVSRSICAVRSRASAAFWSASDARTFASATALSASATRLSSAVLARFENSNSPQTPTAISASPPRSQTHSGHGCQTARNRDPGSACKRDPLHRRWERLVPVANRRAPRIVE